MISYADGTELQWTLRTLIKFMGCFRKIRYGLILVALSLAWRLPSYNRTTFLHCVSRAT